MNPKIIGLVAAIVVVAGGIYFFTAKDAQSPTEVANTNTQSNTEETLADNNSKRSLKDIVGLGGGQKCTYAMDNGSGTLYAGNGKARMDLAIQTSGQTIMSHMIVDGTTSYSWQDGQTTGIKITTNPSAPTNTPETSQQNNNTVDPNTEFDYDCSSWSIDNSLLTPPSNVTFQDLGASLQIPGGF